MTAKHHGQEIGSELVVVQSENDGFYYEGLKKTTNGSAKRISVAGPEKNDT